MSAMATIGMGASPARRSRSSASSAPRSASYGQPSEFPNTLKGDQTPRVLIPFDRREALTLAQAAEIAGRSIETIRRWASLEDIGRRVGGQWAVSHVALLMFLDGDRSALRSYLSGDRGLAVRPYFERAGLE